MVELTSRPTPESGADMTLSPGTRLGQYEIGDAIGAGGMGGLSGHLV